MVVEWRKVYINYRGLKKLIKKVDARHKARLSKDLSRHNSRSSSKRILYSSLQGLRKRPSPRSNQGSDFERTNDSAFLTSHMQGADYGGMGKGAGLATDEHEDDEDDSLPTVNLNGTGLALVSSDYDFKTDSAASEITKVSSGEEGSGSSGIKQPERTEDVDIEASALSVPASTSAKPNSIDRGKSASSLAGALRSGNAKMDGKKNDGKKGKKKENKKSESMFLP